MQNERNRILKLVENGTISAEEAIVLLEGLEKGKKNEQPGVNNENDQRSESEENSSSKEEKFVEDLKRDFGQFSNRLMDFLGSAVNKVKDMDFSTMTAGGHKIEWAEDLGSELIRNISADIPNGQLTIRDSADGSAHIDVRVSSMIGFSTTNFNELDIKKQFSAFNDNGTLRIISTSKTVKIDVIVYLPKGEYTDLKAGLFNGSFSLQSLNVGRIRVQTKNGSIDMNDVNFDTADLESTNGAIEIREVSGRELEAKTMNGRVYVDGVIRSIEAKTMNGHVVLTTRSQEAERIKANTTAGSIELYIPSTLSLAGEVVSSFGKMDVELNDVELLHETDKMFSKSLRFNKTVKDSQQLSIDGETTTGSVIIRYIL